jgi:glycosyltransferase involved in cell wall biosynthesis
VAGNGNYDIHDSKNKAHKICHLITDLATGGAEMMLYKLVISECFFEHSVISMIDIGPVGEKIRDAGIPVYTLKMRRGRMPDPRVIWRLVGLLSKERPEVLQTWMYHANLLGLIVGKIFRIPHIVWGIHHNNLDPQANKKMTIKVAQWCARFSRFPSIIVACAEASRQVHIALGYRPNKIRVIPNGFDLKTFKPDGGAQKRVKNELGLPQDIILIGLVARFHPQKDHANFLQAAAILKRHFSNINFILCGDGITSDNQELFRMVQQSGIEERVYLLGRREDIPQLTAALDIASSSSCGEAFPIVIGEAMACGVSCVVTDVGDSARIVWDTGFVVPPKDPEALANAWKELIEMGLERRKELGEKARQRIEKHFALEKVVGEYSALYKELIERKSDV